MAFLLFGHTEIFHNLYACGLSSPISSFQCNKYLLFYKQKVSGHKKSVFFPEWTQLQICPQEFNGWSVGLMLFREYNVYAKIPLFFFVCIYRFSQQHLDVYLFHPKVRNQNFRSSRAHKFTESSMAKCHKEESGVTSNQKVELYQLMVKIKSI